MSDLFIIELWFHGTLSRTVTVSAPEHINSSVRPYLYSSLNVHHWQRNKDWHSAKQGWVKRAEFPWH